MMHFKSDPNAKDLAESLMDLISFYEDIAEESFGRNNFKWANIITIITDTTSVNSGTTSGFMNRLYKHNYQRKFCPLMCSIHSEEIRFKWALEALNSKIFSNIYGPQYEKPKMIAKFNSEKSHLLILLHNINHLIRLEPNEFKEILRTMEDKYPPGRFSMEKYIGDDSLKKKFNKIITSHTITGNDMAYLTETLSCKWFSTAYNIAHYIFSNDELEVYLNQKRYTKSSNKPDTKLEELRLHTLDLIRKVRPYTTELYELVRLYWDHIIILSKNKLSYKNIIEGNQDYLKFAISYLPDSYDDQLVKVLNRHSYLIDPIISVLGGSDDLLDEIIGERPLEDFNENGLELSEEMKEDLKLPMASNMFDSFTLNDWLKLREHDLENLPGFIFRARNSPMLKHIDINFNYSDMKKFCGFNNQPAERLFSDVKQLRTDKAQPKDLAIISDNLILDKRVFMGIVVQFFQSDIINI